MNINKFTEKAREGVAKAIELAKQSNNPQVEPEHLLAALVEQPDGIVPELLRKMNIDVAAAAGGARELLKNMPQAYGGSEPHLSPRFTLVADRAQAETAPGTMSAPSICSSPSPTKRAGRRPPFFSRNWGSRRTPSRRPSRASGARNA